MNSRTIAETLKDSGICVCPNFLSQKSLQEISLDLDNLRARGQFQPAGVGKGSTRTLGARWIRNDSTYWLDRESTTRAQTLLWRKIDLLMVALNRTLFLGLTDFEGHYAVYPESGFYQRHKDSFQRDPSRMVSFILYLNRNWKPEDGGRLRVYSTGADGVETHRDIDPIGGTLVCFLSGETEHEVLFSLRQRFSLSGWYKTTRSFPGYDLKGISPK